MLFYIMCIEPSTLQMIHHLAGPLITSIFKKLFCCFLFYLETVHQETFFFFKE